MQGDITDAIGRRQRLPLPPTADGRSLGDGGHDLEVARRPHGGHEIAQEHRAVRGTPVREERGQDHHRQRARRRGTP